ncbi:hypothetical protein [Bradyrhizobium liaoningense]|uniref:hypothetical protein n=1 Tax=Bradyrhizobium liaoningense TaxID=43992 RepID=UPI001BA91C6B|nr:hypothetical protein [Bradyrhizobium liaoningense]MBR1168498.1 hypothetical protein [Bradyrhizobium liaoningense]
MYPTTVKEAVIQKMIALIMGPKDQFERFKRRTLRRVFYLLCLVLGGPALILSVLANTDRLSINFRGAFIEFIGRASDDSLYFAVAVVVVYLFSLAANLLYAAYVKAAVSATEKLKNDLDR